MEQIKINELITEGLQMRSAITREVVNEYVEALKDGDKFPPVSVVRYMPKESDTILYLTDGFHRVAAAKRLGYETIAAEVTDGDFTAALRAALGANAAHGLRRTNADKRRALETAWANRALLFGSEKPSDSEVAKVCGVSRMTVFRWKKCNNVTSVKKVKKEDEGEGRDRFGETIPPRLRGAFADKALAEIIEAVNELRHRIDDEIEAEKPAFAQVTQQTRLAFANAYHDLKASSPFCVCRNCRGEGCVTCANTGFQTKAQFSRLPAELRVGVSSERIVS